MFEYNTCNTIDRARQIFENGQMFALMAKQSVTFDLRYVIFFRLNLTNNCLRRSADYPLVS